MPAGWRSWEPDTQDPEGETLLQLSDGPSSQVPRASLKWNGRPQLLPPPPNSQSTSSGSSLLDGPADPSEGQSVDMNKMNGDSCPSERLSVTQTSSSTSRGGRARQQSYIPKEFWDPRLVKDHEAFKAAPSSDCRKKIWLSWSDKERRLVYLASSVRSRQEQLSWKAELKFRKRRGRAKDSDDDDDD